MGNPIRYNDPNGHKYCDSDDPSDCTRLSNSVEHTAIKYRIRFRGNWKLNDQVAVIGAVEKVGTKFASERGIGETSSDAFREVYGRVTMQWEGSAGKCGNTTGVSNGGCTDGAHQIRFWSLSGHGQNDINRMIKNVVHELGHAYDWTHYDPSTKTRASDYISSDFTRDALLRPNLKTSEGQRWNWQQSDKNTSNEIFADMFLAWTYGAWNNDPLNIAVVNSAQSWMNGLVP